MLDKAQQTATSRRRAPIRGAHGRKSAGALPLPAGLVAVIALLALAAPASAADPVAGVLAKAAEAATPAVAQVVSTPAPVAPTPAAARQAGDVAAKAVPVERAVEHTTGPLTTSSAGGPGSALPAAASRHDLTPAGAVPSHQPASGPRSEGDSHAVGATPSRELGGEAIAGATRPIVSTAGHAPVAAGAVVRGAGLAAGEVTSGVSHATGMLPADRVLHPARLPGFAAQVVETAPGRIATLPAPTVRTLTRPPLPGVAALPELPSLPAPPLLTTLPSLPAPPPLLATLPQLPTAPAVPWPSESEQSPTPAFPAAPTPVFSAAPPPAASPRPVAPSSPGAGTGSGGATPASVTAPQEAWPASSVVQAYQATANGIGGVIGAPERPVSSTSAAAGALRRAASEVSWAAGATASAYGLTTSVGTTRAAPDRPSPGRAYEHPSPAPSPGSAAPASGAVAGTSIPIFLTLAGLLLLAAPRARRVLRLLGETWRLSPLALILERPG